MKKIGLIGGMSWESTALYYQHINKLVNQRLGGVHSASLLLWSFDFDEIVGLQLAGDWARATERMVEAAVHLKEAGADALVICTNTMHKMAGEIEEAAGIPVLHIVDAAALSIKSEKIETIGLLATRFTMEQDFYKNRLRERHQITTLVPDERGRKIVHQIIYDELCQGITKESSKQQYLDIITCLVSKGAQGILLGCTEIGILIRQEDIAVPVFDSTMLHAITAVDFALS